MKVQYNGVMGPFAETIMRQRYSHLKRNKKRELWKEISHRTARNVLGAVGTEPAIVKRVSRAIRERKLMPGGRYLSASGRAFHQTNSCFLFRAEDSREGWAELMYKSSMALMTGGGIGCEYSDVRAEHSPIRKTGGISTGPLALMQMVNEAGRFIEQGGNIRSAIWAGLRWDHGDIHKFIRLKDWPASIRKLKAEDFSFAAPMDGTNVSVGLDDAFFKAYHDAGSPQHDAAHSVYWAVVERMLKTSEPGFSINVGENSKEDLRNACTEVCSADDSDVCNLLSPNMARIESVEEFRQLLELAVLFCTAGTVYSDVPFGQVDTIRTKNRRLGIGLMGLHEWLLVRGKQYGPDADLEAYMDIYATSTEIAKKYALKLHLSAPIKTRAIAPNGTIGIVAETTTGIEPIFCVAFKRRYLKHHAQCYQYQYVLDPTAKRLIQHCGVAPGAIEDAYSLANDAERRLAFQAWVQQYVDHGISSTINLPRWGSPQNNEGTVTAFGNMLINYLPKLRGMTVYADGSRDGQPLTPIKYETAMKHEGKIFEETVDVCDITKAGSCGG